MIQINDTVYEQVMRVLRASNHIEARAATNRMRLAAIEAATREFNNEAPALCREQA